MYGPLICDDCDEPHPTVHDARCVDDPCLEPMWLCDNCHEWAVYRWQYLAANPEGEP